MTIKEMIKVAKVQNKKIEIIQHLFTANHWSLCTTDDFDVVVDTFKKEHFTEEAIQNILYDRNDFEFGKRTPTQTCNVSGRIVVVSVFEINLL